MPLGADNKHINRRARGLKTMDSRFFTLLTTTLKQAFEKNVNLDALHYFVKHTYIKNIDLFRI